MRKPVWIFFICAAALAQDPNAPLVINTDRPAFTDASTVIPKQTFQMENGFLDTAESGHHLFDLPETQLRLGLAAKIELRFSLPDYFASGPLQSGWSDVLLGVKQQLGPVYGFDVSIVASLSFPTGSKQISSHGYDPELQVPWSRKLSSNWTTAGMFSVYWPTQGTRRNTTGQVTYLFDRQLTSPWDAFIEYAAEIPAHGGPQHILHLGTAYKLTPHQQLDFHFGFGLSASAPDHFVGFGYSVVLGKPLKPTAN